MLIVRKSPAFINGFVNAMNVARHKIFSWVILAFALMLYSGSMPKEVRKCSIHSAIDSQGFTDFIQTCRIHIVAG